MEPKCWQILGQPLRLRAERPQALSLRLPTKEYRKQNIQNTECRAFPDMPVNAGAGIARDKGWAADAVGLQVAQTYDHESGEPQEWLRFEPSTPGTHCVWAHRLYGARVRHQVVGRR